MLCREWKGRDYYGNTVFLGSFTRKQYFHFRKFVEDEYRLL